MKKLTVVLTLSVVAGCMLLTGCSKSENAKARSEANPKPAQPASVSSDSAELRVKWPVGVKYAQQMELDQTSETKIPNMPEPMRQKVKLTQDFDMSAIKELPNGGRELELQFKGLKMEVSQGGQVVLVFDSSQTGSQDSNNPVAPLLRKMVGGKVRYLTSADGKVEKVEGVNELMTRIGFNRKSQQHALFQQMFSEETLKNYGTFGEMMPNRIVKVGESWSVKDEIGTGIGKMLIDMKYTFKKWEPCGDYKCALIKMEGKMSAGAGAPSPGATMKIKDGTMSGDVWFDPQLGMMVNQVMDQDMTISVVAGAQTLTPRVKQKIHVSLTDVRKSR